LVMFSSASSISISVFKGISKVIYSWRVSLQQFQSVFLLYKDGIFLFPWYVSKHIYQNWCKIWC
jgi:hypothetical protein